MEFKTVKSRYITFCMTLGGIVIGISMAALFGRPMWPVLLILAAIILTPHLFFNIILSINVVDDHLVLKTTQLFREKTMLFNIREVELPLFYTPPKPRRRGSYSMRVIRSNRILHEIEYDVKMLSAFILDFNQKKSKYLTP